MRLLIDTQRTMSSGSSNFLLVPIPEYPVLDIDPNKNVKIVVLGASNVGKTGRLSFEVISDRLALSIGYF